MRKIKKKPKTVEGVALNKTLEIYELLSKAMNLLAEMTMIFFDKIKEREEKK